MCACVNDVNWQNCADLCLGNVQVLMDKLKYEVFVCLKRLLCFILVQIRLFKTTIGLWTSSDYNDVKRKTLTLTITK